MKDKIIYASTNNALNVLRLLKRFEIQGNYKKSDILLPILIRIASQQSDAELNAALQYASVGKEPDPLQEQHPIFKENPSDINLKLIINQFIQQFQKAKNIVDNIFIAYFGFNPQNKNPIFNKDYSDPRTQQAPESLIQLKQFLDEEIEIINEYFIENEQYLDSEDYWARWLSYIKSYIEKDFKLVDEANNLYFHEVTGINDRLEELKKVFMNCAVLLEKIEEINNHLVFRLNGGDTWGTKYHNTSEDQINTWARDLNLI